jgi:hypothetical protein
VVFPAAFLAGEWLQKADDLELVLPGRNIMELDRPGARMKSELGQ